MVCAHWPLSSHQSMTWHISQGLNASGKWHRRWKRPLIGEIYRGLPHHPLPMNILSRCWALTSRSALACAHHSVAVKHDLLDSLFSYTQWIVSVKHGVPSLAEAYTFLSRHGQGTSRIAFCLQIMTSDIGRFLSTSPFDCTSVSWRTVWPSYITFGLQ